MSASGHNQREAARIEREVAHFLATGEADVLGRAFPGNDWQFRAQASRTDGQWRRIWKTFTPGTKDTDFTLRISTESPTSGVGIDDLKLEEGTAPTSDPLEESDKVFLEAEQAQTLIQGDGPFSVAFTLSNGRPRAGR